MEQVDGKYFCLLCGSFFEDELEKQEHSKKLHVMPAAMNSNVISFLVNK